MKRLPPLTTVRDLNGLCFIRVQQLENKAKNAVVDVAAVGSALGLSLKPQTPVQLSASHPVALVSNDFDRDCSMQGGHPPITIYVN